MPRIHQRRSIRIPGYDYTSPGVYFLTLCTHERRQVFGSIQGGKMILSRAGEIAQNELKRLSRRFPLIEMGEYVVMPDHVHLLVFVVEPGTGCAEQFGQPVAGSIPTIVRSYKASVTWLVMRLPRWPGGAVWQRNYYEHIVRDEAGIDMVSAYIRMNPERWVGHGGKGHGGNPGEEIFR